MAARSYPSFLVYLDDAGEFRWWLQAANHKIVADSGQSYFNYQDCRDSISIVGSPHSVWLTQQVFDRLSPSGGSGIADSLD